jgi:hypothetical protein
MTEPGLSPEGAPACPFVAFEDDRDARSTVPDHRHRCFAEPRPAPRALAHQEAYCLSSAFPVCPTFQDWARREAAAARPTAGSGAASREDLTPESHAIPPGDREPERPPGYDPATGYDPGAAYDPESTPPPRNRRRDWAAPPPWTGDDEGPAVGAIGAAAAGAHDPLDPAGDVPQLPPRRASPASASPQDWGSEARGLAGSAAYRLAGPDPDEPRAAAPQAADTGPDEGEDEDDWTAGAAATATAAVARPRSASPEPAPPASAPAPASRQPASQARPEPRPPGADGDPTSARGRQDAAGLFGPAWEAPRRYEAYPTLRTRVGLPSFGRVPRLGVAALVIGLAAVFLFTFGPTLLGFGRNDQPGGGGGRTPAPAVETTDTPEPTTPAPPTPHGYVVAKGDTFSKIAGKFGVSVEELKAANPQIKNIDKIQIGDQVTIPAPTEDDASAQP